MNKHTPIWMTCFWGFLIVSSHAQGLLALPGLVMAVVFLVIGLILPLEPKQ